VPIGPAMQRPQHPQLPAIDILNNRPASLGK
jgi:hypothetical protein